MKGIHWFNGQTHFIVWNTLQEWAETPGNGERVLDAFKILGLSGSEWAEACNSVVNCPEIAKKWLTNWSMDLSRLRSDSYLRNDATYLPDFKERRMHPLGFSEFRSVCDLNKVVLPEEPGVLRQLDLAILRDFCDKSAMLRFGNTDPAAIDKLLRGACKWLHIQKGQDLIISRDMIQTLRDTETNSATQILRLSDAILQEPINVMCRALLLLRLASALVRIQWQMAQQLSHTAASSWQDKVLMGIAGNAHLVDTFDLTEEVDWLTLDEDAIQAQEELSGHLRSRRNFQPFGMWKMKSESFLELSRFERVGLWILANEVHGVKAGHVTERAWDAHRSEGTSGKSVC